MSPLLWDRWDGPETPTGRHDDATLADRYEAHPQPRVRPWPTRSTYNPTDDAGLPIPYYGGAA